MHSIETAQAAAKKQIPPSKTSTKILTKQKVSGGYFEDLGVGSSQFQLFFQNLPVGITLNKVVYNQTGVPVDFVMLDVNPEFEKAVGLKKGQLINKHIGEFYPEIKNGSVDWIALYGRVASTGKPERLDACFPSNGHNYYVTVFRPKKGYCLSSFVDITEQKNTVLKKLAERKKVEEELKESLEKYRYLLKHAPTAIFEVDYDGPRFISVNDAMCQILGYSEQELLSMNPLDLLFPENKERVYERMLKDASKNKIDETFEYHAKTKNGNEIWATLNARIIYNRGKSTTALIVAHDITARKKAEQEYLLSEKRFRRLYETTQDGIMARDLQGRMIACNSAYAKMLGYTRKELRALSVKQLLPEKWHEQREKIANKVLQTGRSIVFEREYKRKDGSIFPASVRTWRLTDGKGKVIGIWSIVRDISEQKELQKTLEEHAGVLAKIVEERTRQLKNTERLVAIGQTAGMVGHDLRNPLQTISGELYLAKSEVESLADGEIKNNLQESIRMIEEQAAYMDKIVSDLQAFVQPVRIDKKPVDLNILVAGVLETVPIPQEVAVHISNQGSFPQVKADPHLLKRVLINLVTNAVQAMPNGGSLSIAAELNAQEGVSISVQDTGVGIADGIKSQIFSPLFTTKPRGQGFGLAVCKRVIEAHGGSIGFESTEGKGTSFTVLLPAS